MAFFGAGTIRPYDDAPWRGRGTLETFETKDAWLLARKGGLGGSDAAPCLGVSKYRTPLDLYVEKVGLAPGPADNPLLRRGRLLEPIVVGLYEELTTATVARYGHHLVRDSEYPWMTFSVDGMVDDDTLLECKTYANVTPAQLTQHPPADLMVQIMQGMRVTGASRCHVAVFSPTSGEFFWTEYPRNEEAIALLITKERDFWRRVQAQEPPEPSAATDDIAIRLLYPEERPGVYVALGDEGRLLHEERVRHQSDEQSAHAAKTFCDVRLKKLIGDAAGGTLPDGARYSWATVQKKEYTVAASSYRRLSLSKKKGGYHGKDVGGSTGA